MRVKKWFAVLLLSMASFALGLYGNENGLIEQNARAGGAQFWKDATPDHKAYIDPAYNQAMTKLVQSTLPAVVSIATEQVIKGRGRGGMPSMNGEPMGDFFDFFFNQPQNPGGQFKQQGVGSGFVISEDGYILTNSHVVENADQITVQLAGGEELAAKVVGRDETTDIALIKVAAKKSLPALVLGNSDQLEIGHIVVAMGSPLGLAQTVTQGIVSQKGRKDIQPSGRHIYANFIQTDASINPGNSGGPLVNIYGEVVGINTAIAQGTGIGFAIPINMARTLLPRLKEGHIERSYIGIRLQEVTKPLADSLGLEGSKGALVAAVVPGSPAAKAGLKEEDVILEFDGKPIDKHSDLTWLASTAGIGKDVALKVWRDHKALTVTVKLGRMPGDVAETENGEKTPGGEHKALGIHVVTPDRDQLKALGIEDGEGAVVTEIEAESPAQLARLMPGDVIRKVNATRIKNAEGFVAALKALHSGETVRLFVNRSGMALFMAFRMP